MKNDIPKSVKLFGNAILLFVICYCRQSGLIGGFTVLRIRQSMQRQLHL